MSLKFRRTKLSSVVVALGLSGALVSVPTASAVTKPRAAAKLGDRALRVGAVGPDVRELQKLLRQVGFEVRKVDGQFGTATRTAVRAFQTARSLDASGTVGRKTVAALREAALGGAAQGLTAGGFDDTVGAGRSNSLGDRIPVRRGMSGRDVKMLQDFLKRVGQRVVVDGEFGNGTVTAVKGFEKTNALDVDGLVDANDIAVLRGQADAGKKATAAQAPLQLAPGDRATVGPDGLAIAPQNAPESVKAMIAAGNKIAKLPYIYGGGHGKWEDKGYDCSGSVSYALYKGGVLKASMPSGGFMSWGDAGPGQWVSIYANEGHMYAVIAGLRFDTSGAKQDGTRWHATSRPTKGYVVRHPKGL
ncbi:MAG: peptidoglycan-binding protein [Solirubrobacterales bacterium]|nr:peptidoglycan-binding protein [Solirubrobacterales bacterium]